MKAAWRYRDSIGTSFPVVVGGSRIPPGGRVGHYDKTCELEGIPKVLEIPTVIESVLNVATFNNQVSKKYTPLDWYYLTTQNTNSSESVILDITRNRYGPTTTEDIRTALSALNISSTIITDSNGKEFVEVLPFAQTEVLNFFLESVATNTADIDFGYYEYGHLRKMAQEYMDEVKQNQ
jgi:hypothetical protein